MANRAGESIHGTHPYDPESAASDGFYARLPTFPGFEAIVDPRSYTPLPGDWVLGLSDVVTSTQAIAEGRYKAVNTAGASVISAVSNALGTLDFPFVFGGDGASFAVGPSYAKEAGQALAATVAWVGAELGLRLRGATIQVGDVRAAGFEVKVARFAASDDVTYAMFSGGGRAWAERRLKDGSLASAPAPPGARPDLTGLSCRFQDMHSANGVILSVIVVPAGATDDPRFLAVVSAVIAIAGDQPRQSHPVPSGGPDLRWPPTGFDTEARLQRRTGQPLLFSRITVGLRTLFYSWALRKGRKLNTFSADAYRRQAADNSDFRKFDDGLMMTLDCSEQAAIQIEAALIDARRNGVVRFGLHRQSTALVTCVVPSALRADHVHFVDGAAGGYAMAARNLKSDAS